MNGEIQLSAPASRLSIVYCALYHLAIYNTPFSHIKLSL